ncbi:MAG TPA: DUF2335 domain-containing protein [Kofleriaceae bacterium]|jgi:uncharacterized membrane protein
MSADDEPSPQRRESEHVPWLLRWATWQRIRTGAAAAVRHAYGGAADSGPLNSMRINIDDKAFSDPRFARLTPMRASTPQMRVQQQQAWPSPTLPTRILAEYQQVVPDSGERFFAYMEREQGQRHENQRAVLRHSAHAQFFVFLLSGLAIVGVCVCAVIGQTAGLALGAAGLLPLVQPVYQRHKQTLEAEYALQLQQLEARNGSGAADDAATI